MLPGHVLVCDFFYDDDFEVSVEIVIFAPEMLVDFDGVLPFNIISVLVYALVGPL